MSILSSFVSGFQKSHSFSCMTIRNARTCVSKSDVITLPVFFWPLYSKKIKILLWIFLSGLCVCMLITHILFLWISWKIWIMCATIYEKWNKEFWVLGDKIGNITNLICSLCRTCNVWRFSIAFHFRTEDSSSLPAFAVFFLPKMAKHDVTKTQFSQKISRQNFLSFWRQTSNWCWGRY